MFIKLIDYNNVIIYVNILNISSFCCDEGIYEVYTNDNRAWHITKESYEKLLSRIKIVV